MQLTIDLLIKEAKYFCKTESDNTHNNLIGITDGKAVGTYIEHKFKEYLKNKYDLTYSSSAKGIDLPDPQVNTDIKVTSVKKPQSSSPFKNIEQKIYGLGHNLLIFVYEKTDINNKCYLHFKNCIFIESEKTGDYNLTKILRILLKNNAEKGDIIEILKDNNLPGDIQSLEKLTEKIFSYPPKQGYLTISNAFQWRLKYNNIINLEKHVDGIYNFKEPNENELADYQTPAYLTDMICEYLKNNLKISPEVIIEPTCGIGNFIKSISRTFPKKQIYGIDIDQTKLNKIDSSNPNIRLFNENVFNFNFKNISKNKSILIIGNPPGIINTELKINSKIIQTNSNFKKLRKMDTMMRNSNFDISEYIILRLIDEFKDSNATIAFLCKTTISRNIFIELIKNNIKYSFVKQLNFNSSKIFKIDNNTCLFIIQFGGPSLADKTCEVSNFSEPTKILHKFGFISDKFYSNIKDIPQIDGKCQMEWRQGVKHDCAKIMELNHENNQYINKNNENVSIEDTLIYPLLKSSQLKKPIVKETSRKIIITQKKIKQNTDYIKTEAPKTWKYLNENKEFFDKRKSSIYKNTPNFSIFGIGDYSFKKYKVAISGFCKNPMFSLVYSDKIMMLDDACYFLSFDNYDEAYITMLILNSQLVKKFLKNIAFLDSKRPFAKKILKRIDIQKCLDQMTLSDLKETEKELNLNKYITEDKLKNYIKLFN